MQVRSEEIKKLQIQLHVKEEHMDNLIFQLEKVLITIIDTQMIHSPLLGGSWWSIPGRNWWEQ